MPDESEFDQFAQRTLSREGAPQPTDPEHQTILPTGPVGTIMQPSPSIPTGAQLPGGNQSPVSGGELSQVLAAMAALLQQNTKILEEVRNERRGAQETMHYNIMPNLSGTIRDFEGTETPVEAQAWLKQLEATATLHRWTCAIALETAKNHLTKAAKNWYLSRLDTITDWTNFRTAFTATFLHGKSMTERWQEMTERIQHPKEDTREYFHDKIRRCRALGLSFAEIKNQVAVGLWSKDLSDFILTKEVKDEDTLLQNIVEYERVATERRRRAASTKISWVATTPGSTGIMGATNEVKPSTGAYAKTLGTVYCEGGYKPKSSASDDQRVCYNCNGVGHYAKYCDKPPRVVKCYACGENGHIARNCTKPKPMSTGEIKNVECESNETSINKYVKYVYVNGCNFKALIDTGSSDCTIKASAVLNAGFNVIRQPSELRGFGKVENIVKSCGVIIEKVIVDDASADRVTLRVIPDDVQYYDVIIGRNFTELPHIIYFKLRDKLHFQIRDDEAANYSIAEINQNNVQFNVEKNVTLEPGTIQFIETRVNHNEIKLPIITLGEERVTLKAGTKLGDSIMTVENMPEVELRVEPILLDELTIDPKINVPDRTELLKLLNQYRVCIAKNITELGCTSMVEMDIQLKPGSTPIHSKPYKASMADREIMKRIIGEWKKVGIIRDTTSPYASPCLLVKKRDGDYRLVIDYRRLNANTLRIHYPLTNLDDCLEVLYGATVFIILDLAHGYLQIPLKEDAKEKTAFITPDETGEFQRVMFGLMNGPFYFAKLMKQVFGSHHNKVAISYFDDMFLFASSWSELMEKLKTVLELLKKAGLTLNITKCKFGMEKIEYLGFTITKNGIAPDENKVRAIAEYPEPTNVHEVRRFMGLASFFRRFIPKFAQIAAPITNLLKKNENFSWTNVQTDAFREITERLLSQPILRIFNINSSRTELHTDASQDGLAAILLQSDELDNLHLVYAVSKRTSEVERNYHSSKLELLAIIWALERLRTFLIGLTFTVYTDCQALIYIQSMKTQQPQIVRWLATIADYEFEIKHRKAERMQHVDALSRAPVEQVESEQTGLILNITIREDEILIHQRTDENLNNKINILKKAINERTKYEKGVVDSYVLRDGLLYKQNNEHNAEKMLYVIPKSMRKAMVLKYHDFSSHVGLDRTVARLKQYYYFPKMRSYVKKHIRSCVECILAKSKPGKQAGELHPIPVGSRPFETINVDHLGPFVSTVRNNKYLLAIIDNLTKFTQIVAVRNVNASTTVRKIDEFVQKFGAPKKLISDRGTCFTSKKFKEFCNKYGIHHTLNSSRHPQANGLVERLNETILPAMQVNLNQFDGRDWDLHISKLERDLNTSINKSTNKTPFEALYGYIPRFEDGLLRNLTEHCEIYRIPVDIQDEIRQKVVEEQKKYKDRYDKSRHIGIKYKVGDIVYMKSNPIATGESTKLQSRYKGPLVITDVLPSDTYRVAKLNDCDRRQLNTTAHVSQLKIWTKTDDESMSEESDEESDKTDALETTDSSNELKLPECDKNTSNEPPLRPKRKITKPKKFEDYV